MVWLVIRWRYSGISLGHFLFGFMWSVICHFTECDLSNSKFILPRSFCSSLFLLKPILSMILGQQPFISAEYGCGETKPGREARKLSDLFLVLLGTVVSSAANFGNMNATILICWKPRRLRSDQSHAKRLLDKW